MKIIVSEGGSFFVKCFEGTINIEKAYYGSERKSFITKSLEVCNGEVYCCFPVKNENFEKDPDPGYVKELTVFLKGCKPTPKISFEERICRVSGHKLDENNIKYLSRISFPKPKYFFKNIAVCIDTTWRPLLQKFVVNNIHKNLNWNIQLFHGISNENKLKNLLEYKKIYFTNLQTDDMNWFRMSSLMLLPIFWKACMGRNILIFQPDSITCSKSTLKIENFLKYDYVGAPMAGQWWKTTDHPSEWTVGNGGFSLRKRKKMIEMTHNPGCITPASGKLEDQQLSVGWKYLETRCNKSGTTLNKPDRQMAVRFSVEYDLFMDILPNENKNYSKGCVSNYYTGLKTPYFSKVWYKNAPKCKNDFFVPIACHKCWNWNKNTWEYMNLHCPETIKLRKLQKKYRVGAEFTGSPKIPKITNSVGKLLNIPIIYKLEKECLNLSSYTKESVYYRNECKKITRNLMVDDYVSEYAASTLIASLKRIINL
jgi:hypothetical protein